MSGINVIQEVAGVVYVYGGPRGKQGIPGPQGPQGEAGLDINVRGPWNGLTQYCPNDAVTADSSAAQGILSLWVQKTDWPCSISHLPPREDPNRWVEQGATDLSNVTGAIWTVSQSNHPFQYVGQAAAYDESLDQWVLADNRVLNLVGLALVRDVPNSGEVTLQTTGELPGVQDGAILEAGGMVPGALYYVSNVPGKLTVTPPTDASSYSNPIMVGAGGGAGVVVPWRPIQVSREKTATPINKYFYSPTFEGQTTFSGPDSRGETLAYPLPSKDNLNVFKNGLLLRDTTDYTANDGTTVVLTSPTTMTDHLEMHANEYDSSLVLPNVAAKLDNISGQFDGAQTKFLLTSGSQDIEIPAAENVAIYLDGVNQEPSVDYTTSNESNKAYVTFNVAPEAGTSFWGLFGLPYGQQPVFLATFNDVISTWEADLNKQMLIATFDPGTVFDLIINCIHGTLNGAFVAKVGANEFPQDAIPGSGEINQLLYTTRATSWALALSIYYDASSGKCRLYLSPARNHTPRFDYTVEKVTGSPGSVIAQNGSFETRVGVALTEIIPV